MQIYFGVGLRRGGGDRLFERNNGALHDILQSPVLTATRTAEVASRRVCHARLLTSFSMSRMAMCCAKGVRTFLEALMETKV
jgi:hypothetical protein